MRIKKETPQMTNMIEKIETKALPEKINVVPQNVKKAKSAAGSIPEPAKKVSVESPKPKRQIRQNNGESALIIQPKPVDARWSVQGLSKNVAVVMDRDPSDGNMYAFINKWFTIMLIMQFTEKGPSVLKRKFEEEIDWPSLSSGTKDTTITLKGEEKNKFLQKTGCPKDLSV